MDEVVVAGIVVFIILLWWYINSNSVKVYRFYRPTCRYCVESQTEWNTFKRDMQFKMVRCIEINLDDDVNTNKEMFSSYGGRGVPYVVAVDSSGKRYVYDGPRLATAYANWVGSI
jgi:glutaredoxin